VKRRKGVTLLELLIVLGIVTILVALALPGYKRFMLTARTTEAKVNIGAIIICEDSYAADADKYLTERYYPDGSPGTSARIWNPDNSGNFKEIGFQPSGRVYYSYGVAAGDQSSNPAGANPSHGEVAVTKNADITVIAKGDLDGDGRLGYFCTTDLRYPKIKGSIGDI